MQICTVVAASPLVMILSVGVADDCKVVKSQCLDSQIYHEDNATPLSRLVSWWIGHFATTKTTERLKAIKKDVDLEILPVTASLKEFKVCLAL